MTTARWEPLRCWRRRDRAASCERAARAASLAPSVKEVCFVGPFHRGCMMCSLAPAAKERRLLAPSVANMRLCSPDSSLAPFRLFGVFYF